MKTSEILPSAWPIQIGEKMKRKRLHGLVGGAHQWGITSCMNGRAILVFSNPGKSKDFGYDRWEGAREDGLFHYTGQGPVGDQDVSSRANKSLLRSKARGLPVHLFMSSRTDVTYFGLHQLAENPYRWERALDQTGQMRRVIVFHLVQVQVNQI
jgi:hypothetical protein